MAKFVAAILALILVAFASAAPAQESGLRLVDLTGEFDRFASSTAGMEDAARIAAFEQQMGLLADGFYARSRNPERYDRNVLRALTDYPERRAGILQVSRDFTAAFAEARRSFEQQFGPVSSSQPVYLLHSLGEMDGGTRKLGGNSTLVFGADVIAQIHAGKDIAPFFHHELFHVFHDAKMADCEGIWCSLWEEGLATYVAQTLNPGAGDAALMLDLPAPIRPAVDANRQAAICAVVPILDSAKDEDYAALFFGNSHLPGFPARMGYYIGYLIAADLGRTRSLQQLAALQPADVKPLIERSLAGMADCEAESGERG